MFTNWKNTATILLAIALLNMSASTAFAEDRHHAHSNGKPAQLTLDNGKKWATDDSLRQGMSRIRDALTAELADIHSGRATAAQYRALAQKTNSQIAFLVKNCRLEQKADAMLHLVLADIIAGADAMVKQNNNEARKGAEKIARALDNYGTYFDHPGWQGMKHNH